MFPAVCIAAILLLLSPALAFEIGNGPCPSNMTSIADLDMSRYHGKWYPVLMFPDLMKNVPKCKSINIIEGEDKQYSIRIKSIDRRSGTVTKLNQKILKVEPQAGKYILDTRNKGFPHGVEVYILDTDYDHFTIHYMCFDADKVINFQWAAIYTRTRMPAVDTIYAAKQLAKFSGLEVKKFVRIPQEACPTDT